MVLLNSLVPIGRLATWRMHLKKFSVKQHGMFAIRKYGIISVTNLINDLKWDTKNTKNQLNV